MTGTTRGKEEEEGEPVEFGRSGAINFIYIGYHHNNFTRRHYIARHIPGELEYKMSEPSISCLCENIV